MIGSEHEVQEENLAELAFPVTDNLTILGFKVRNSNDNFGLNAERILEKIRGQIRTWSRYNLSLPGRLEVAKSMLYSQLNYMGCIIQIPEDLLDIIEHEIYKFASSNLRISKQRVFTGTEMGGLGLFNVRNFLDAQICSWVKRCGTVDQDWKARLLVAGTGNLYQVHCALGLGDLFPVLNNISRAYGNFVEKFTKNKQKLC
jgi:hypothetical protein